MHESTKINYGTVGERYGERLGELMDKMGLDHLLDYGCGHNLSLRKTLKPERPIRYQAYDPGVPEYADDPEPAQIVACIDVLEHIEPECLDDVLDHIEQLTQIVLFATVHLGPAGKTLPDGRNAHLIQKPPEWWLPKFLERFDIVTFEMRGAAGFEVLMAARDYHSGLGAVDDAA